MLTEPWQEFDLEHAGTDQAGPGHADEAQDQGDKPDAEYYEMARQLVHARRAHGYKNPTDITVAFARGEMATLGFLSSRDGGATPSQIAAEFDISSARVANLLNGLEHKGYVVRERSAEDRRKVNAKLTPEGLAVMSKRHDEGMNRLATMLAALGEQDARDLVRISRKIGAICDAQAEASRACPDSSRVDSAADPSETPPARCDGDRESQERDS